MADIIRPKFKASERQPIREEESYERWERERKECQHRRSLVVSASERAVWCDDCKKHLDPIQVLLEIANRNREQYYKHQELARLEKKFEEKARKEEERRAAKRKKREEGTA